MRLSRETRITLGVLTLCAALFVWINLLTGGTATETLATTALAQEAPLLSEVQRQETSEGINESASGGASEVAVDEVAVDEVAVDEVAFTSEEVTLSLSSTPEGATVLLNNEPLEGVTPFSEAPVEGVEEARLRVEREGYLPYEGFLDLSFNRNISVYLEPLPPGAASGGVVAGEATLGEATLGEAMLGEVISGDAASGGASLSPSASVAGSDTVSTTGSNTVSNGTMVAREVIIDELPFLITAPPQRAAVSEDSGEAGVETIARPQGEQRASVNPFSPLVLKVETLEETPSSPEQELVVVPVPDESTNELTNELTNEFTASAVPVIVTAAPREAIKAPAPRPLAPPAPRTTSLPRALPQGSLPVTPRILDTRRTRTPQPPDLAAIAAIRVPDAPKESALASVTASVTASVSAPAASAASSATSSAGAGVDAVEGPGATLEPLALAKQNALGGAPLFAGTNELSRYLRDNDVTFTGTVAGPVGVGVFRFADSGPVVVALGATLPDTDIVLSNLSGTKAEFTQGTLSQTLDRR